MASERIDAEGTRTALGWKERIAAGWSAATSLISTRMEIFQQELSEKTGFAARGAAGVFLGLVFGWLALLLFTALVASLLALLFGRVWAGLLAAFVLYLIVAGLLVWMGVKAFSRVRPFDFPNTSGELKKDWSAIRRSASPDERIVPSAYRAPAPAPAPVPEPPSETLEERFRAGSGEGGE